MSNDSTISPSILKQIFDIYSSSNDTTGSDTYPLSLVEAIKKLDQESHQIRQLEPGDILFLQDDIGEDMYWIESGAFAILKGELDRPRLLAIRYANDILGEMALLNNMPRSATVVAIVPSTVGRVEKETFLQFLNSVPGSGVELMRLLSTRLREQEEKILSSMNVGLNDHLTGAHSRLALDTLLPEEIKRAGQRKFTLGVVFIDLDRFKEVNDRLGHSQGDVVLATFARRIQSNLRAEDLFFRYGGDEFVLLIPDTDPQRATTVVERLQETVCGVPFSGTPSFFLGFSAGVAYYPFDGDDPKELLEIADQRAYQAKWAGGGRVKGETLGPKN